MNRTERLYQIDRLLRANGFATFGQIQQHLEVSRATVKRDIAFMRERLNVPIVFDRESGGYRIDTNHVGPRHELPGIWFDDNELLALLSIHGLLTDLDVGGVLGDRLRPLIERLRSLLSQSLNTVDGSVEKSKRDDSIARRLHDRVHFARAHDRPVAPEHFAIVVRAVLERERLQLNHYSRQRDEHTSRQVSPQRVIHYRNAWYMDAWCHQRDAWRTFALDALVSVDRVAQVAMDPPDSSWRARIQAGYGIFDGAAQATAQLLFDAQAARWVRDEQWHPDQRMELLADGRLMLWVPYADSRELEMDILRHAERVTVLQPEALRQRITARFRLAIEQYDRISVKNQ